MSVCDDLKMKLIETKYEILFSICKQINNQDFHRLVSLIELNDKKPNIYALIEKYDKKSLKCDFNGNEIHKQLYESIKSKCIDVLQLICGHDINAEDMTDVEIQTYFRSKLDEMNTQFTENDCLNKCFDENFLKYQKLFNEYLENVEKYYKKYKIPFELNYDDLDCNLCLSKAQTLCVRNRLLETETIFQKYGNKETIQRLREERKRLESQDSQLRHELKGRQDLLQRYESLPKELLKEYRTLKSDLECREWAINELNRSTGSNGSVVSD